MAHHGIKFGAEPLPFFDIVIEKHMDVIIAVPGMTEEDMLKLMQVKPALQLTQGGAGIFHGEAHIQINEPFVVLETIANGKSLVELVRFRYLAANPFRELTSPRRRERSPEHAFWSLG